MRQLAHPPEIDDDAILRRSVRSRTSLVPYREPILEAYQRYIAAAPNLMEYRGIDFSEPAKIRMIKMFRSTNGGSLSHVRESLRRHCWRCPYCNISAAPDLDHFLSKDEFPCLSIFSWNLIPICSECNRLKERGPQGAFVHSYYDEFPDAPFLAATITFEHGMVLTAFALDLEHVETRFAGRIENHFTKLDLARRYSLVAQERLTALRLSLPDVLRFGGAHSVRSELELRRQEAELLGKNSWEWALFTALVSSQEYCEGRFGGG